MVFNDMLFEKSANVNNKNQQIEKDTNTKSNEVQKEHTKLASSSICLSPASIKKKESVDKFCRRIYYNSAEAKILKTELRRNVPSQSSVGSGYFGLGIPKSPSFHSGLDHLADDYDDMSEILVQTRAKENTASEKTNCAGGGYNSDIIGCKFKFTNIEEIKAKLSNSSFSTISAVKKICNNKMPSSQPQAQEVISSTNQSQSSNASEISITSSSSLSQHQQVSSVSIVKSSNSVSFDTTAASSTMETSLSPRGLGPNTTTMPISVTTSSIVSTLAQHFNAASSATQLLTTASSTLASSNKSPVSAATAIKNILNATKTVGSGNSNNTNGASSVSGTTPQEQFNTISSAKPDGSTSTTSTSQPAPTVTNSSSVTQTIVSGISISLGIGNSTNNSNKITRVNGSNAIQTKLLNITVGHSSNTQCHNGVENDCYHGCQSNNNSDDVCENARLPHVTQTLQQITGSPGRARDRNVFNTSTTAATAVQLPLLRGS